MPGPDEALLPSGTLHIWPNGALFLGADMVNEPHRHFTTSVLLGLEGPVRLKVAKERSWMPVEGAIVAPNVEQQLDASGAKLAILQVDPESEAFARMAHRFGGDPFVVLGDDLVRRLRAVLCSVAAGGSLREAWEGTLETLAGAGAPRRTLDPRIRKVLAIMKRDVLAPPPAGELASEVGLSAGRLIHLFTREMGLPIRRYVLWLRLRDVMISLGAGSTLTEAAHHAGFSDSAHLSRTFRGMFGFPPSAISEARGRVRVALDAEAERVTDSPHPPIDEERLARAAPRHADA